MSLMLIACGSSDAPATAASNAPWPETPFMPQPDPDTVLLPCVLVGTIGLEGSLGQEDDTRPEVTGPDVGNGLAADARSEEHTSELQSPLRISYAVFCLK